jgi:hypothetical protein
MCNKLPFDSLCAADRSYEGWEAIQFDDLSPPAMGTVFLKLSIWILPKCMEIE